MRPDNKRSILIVDDVEQNMQLLGQILHKEGYNLSFAVNGKIALEKAILQPPDLILLDIAMPDMDGFEVCKKLKSHDTTSDIPIIFISAMDQVEDIVKGFEFGGSDYVTKPFNASVLKKRVATHIGLKEKEDLIRLKNEELIHANEQLNLQIQTKDKLFNIIAHDLKSPLNTLLGGLGLLGTRSLDDSEGLGEKEKLKFIQMMQESVHNGLCLINNLMQWAQVQTGAIDFSPSKTSIASVVNEAISLNNLHAVEKKITVRSEVRSDLILSLDGYMIETVIRNLLSNAIKYTKAHGNIVISLESNEHNHIISVTDTGVGMPQKQLEKIFLIGNNHSLPGTMNEKGTGLGLILCKDFIEKHAGSIWAESEEGKGAKLSFSLPRTD